MRPAWITGAQALKQRMLNPVQLAAPAPEAEMPQYMESFLVHLRLLIGVPFDYLIADSRLLPDESIRFFYVDRSWTDRLMDGAVSVGKIGTREQAHHQAHAPVVNQQLDVSEAIVRILQRGLRDFPTAKGDNEGNPRGGDVITGVLLRSAAVSGWSHMDVRAFSGPVKDGTPVNDIDPNLFLPLLRLERLSPSVLIGLFRGIPKLVWCEEPHHGVQFGVSETTTGRFYIPVRDASGHLVISRHDKLSNKDVQLPLADTQILLAMRKGGRRVVAVSQVRKDIVQKEKDLLAKYPPATSDLPPLPAQTGAAGFAISVLNPPWRQRFQGQGGNPGGTGTGKFDAAFSIAATVERPDLQLAIRKLVL
jgi:hypothetical protein